MKEQELRRQICEIGKMLYAREMISAGAGNISARLDDGSVILTPSGVCKGFLKPGDIIKVDLDGNMLEGTGKPTSETKMHLGIMNARPDVRGIVHAHPLHATAFAITGTPVDACVLPEVEIVVGKVPIAPYATFGTQDLFESLAPHLPEHNAVLLGNHGAVTFGKDLGIAHWRMELLDSYCSMLILARSLGPVRKLSLDEMDKIMEAKRKLDL